MSDETVQQIEMDRLQDQLSEQRERIEDLEAALKSLKHAVTELTDVARAQSRAFEATTL